MRTVLDLLADMLQAVNPSDRAVSAIVSFTLYLPIPAYLRTLTCSFVYAVCQR